MQIPSWHAAGAALIALCCTAAAPAHGSAPPPLFAAGNTTDTYFGTTVADPYRALEEVKNPQVQAWMKAQGEFARARLDAIPGRAELLKRLQMYDAVAARVASVERRPGELYFYERRGVTDDQFKLYVRRGLQGQERLLVDPEQLYNLTGTPHAINWFVPSFTGRYVAYGLSAGGSEDASLFVMDATTGKRVLGPVARAQYGGVAWLEDDSGLFFIRLQEMKPGMAPVERFQNVRSVFLRLDGEADRAPVAMDSTDPALGVNPAQDSPYVTPIYGTRWAAGYVHHGTDRELSLYIAPLADAMAGKAQWRRLLAQADAVTAAEFAGERLFALTHKDAARFRLLEGSVERGVQGARELIAQGSGVLTGMVRAADALYVTRRDGAVTRVLRLPLPAAAPVQTLKLPVEGGATFGGVDFRLPGALLTLQSWTRGAQIYLAEGARVTNTRLQPAGKFDALDGYVSTEVLVPSHDGARVPLSIVHKKGLKLDGSNPTLLWGYASYGYTEEPWFSAWRLAWLERGGVFAVANPRGSGAFGQEWYKGGFQQTKPNTWKDFIAAAEYLVAQKYTRPARLGIWGGSAGGILIGRAMTERPDLFAAAIPAVGALDMVRAEFESTGPANIPEFGTHKTEPGFRALLAMSTYHQIKDGVRYPAVLLTHGVNDPRVEVWQSTKTAARLQAVAAAVPDSRPVLLRLDWQAGHGVGDTKAQWQAERADVLAFLLWQFGMSR
ncbi:MAG: prolyl oligopeptidase family serine peptidase [Rhodocyclaceae bacterium]|nr:prolyl oligopeptidase family serine peptidase [Rhodocyclaceae bacterium]MCA3140272.1 prolyl oligopeptidase family serine peptidase [Rhodocyclaceae bacterium]MCZ8033083.1 prolyl oligopeptidase family serine peptidase [Rubrivivax sp.]